MTHISWSLDFTKQTATCQSILGIRFGGMRYTVVHQDGRTFLIGLNDATSISELLPNGTVKIRALIGPAGSVRKMLNNDPAFEVAYKVAFPTPLNAYTMYGPGALWVDRNGDDQVQGDELSFATSTDRFPVAYWGHDFYNLTLRLPVSVGKTWRVATLQPNGYTAAGAPNYPPLNDACKAATPLQVSGVSQMSSNFAVLTNNDGIAETTVDRFGNHIINSAPYMRAFAPDGTLRWSYPNRWTGLHGSHKAPLPEQGMLQGTLFFLGMAPLDDKSDVFVMNGNHGRFFVMTSDGFYLDEFFKDVRMVKATDAYYIGGECFGGTFAKSARTGAYYLQSGHTDYRLFRVNGLDNVVRGVGGALTLTPAHVEAAERRKTAQRAASIEKKVLAIPFLEEALTIDGKSTDWPTEMTGAQWTKSGKFATAVRMPYDADALYLHFTVADSSPWKNQGRDWTQLFKTGDSLDLQFGTDPTANPLRTTPVPGDLRLLIAPYQGKPIAVLYRHRVPKGANPVVFTSPWRSETVSDVQQLTDVRIAVTSGKERYQVEVAVPLASLGLTPDAAQTYRLDLGVIFGDADGQINTLRSYWSNQNTGLVNDVPGEIMLTPNAWGTCTFDAKR